MKFSIRAVIGASGLAIAITSHFTPGRGGLSFVFMDSIFPDE
jgi:hypothetical protein